VIVGETAPGAVLPRIFIISDVHVGAGEIDDFVPSLEAALIAFLDALRRMDQGVELVINGDFFDFATAAPWEDEHLESTTDSGLPLCFTEDQSCRKLAYIIADHGPVFDALARLVIADQRNRITMLPGNHDADLFWPAVRQGILKRLAHSVAGGQAALGGRFTFRLERQLVIERSGQRYWIEHGHQHDPPNSFFPQGVERWSADKPPIFHDRMGHERLYECPGTLGLVRHINHWRPTYRSISYIKPYSSVLRALIAHNAFKEPGRPLMVLRHLVAMLGWDIDLQTALSAEDDLKKACHDAVQTLTQNLTAKETLAFTQALADRDVEIDVPLQEFVATEARRQRVIDAFARESDVKVAREGLQVSEETLGFIAGGFIKDAETKALVQMARKLIAAGQADYVLTGHTHSPCQKLDGRFSNSGCWVPNQAVDSKAQAVEVIFEHGSVGYLLSYLEIGRAGPPRLRRFRRGAIVV
jgi:UDP-2,3-diacylglucosamine pyrophosphatase LpxH